MQMKDKQKFGASKISHISKEKGSKNITKEI